MDNDAIILGAATHAANIVNGVGTCNHLSRTYEDSAQRPGTLSLISEDNPDLGLVMTYEGGNLCNETAHYQLIVQINCNPNLDTTTYKLDEASLATPCDPRVIMNSPHACPVAQTGPLGVFIETHAYWLGLPLVAIGAYFCFVGGRFPSTTLFLFSTLAVMLSFLFFLYMYVLPKFSPTWTVFITGTVALG